MFHKVNNFKEVGSSIKIIKQVFMHRSVEIIAMNTLPRIRTYTMQIAYTYNGPMHTHMHTKRTQ